MHFINDDMDPTPAAFDSSWADLLHFYDVPWNLYRCPGTPPTIQREKLIQKLQLALLKETADDEDARSTGKELSECTVDTISFPSDNSPLFGYAVKAEFTIGSPFKFIHYNNPAKEVSLLLIRGSLGDKSLTESFFEMLGISTYQTLSLPSSLLSSQLEQYLESLVPYRPESQQRYLESFIHNVIGKVDITVTAEAPVAPNLKSLQVGVPAANVWTWLSNRSGRGLFMIRLTDCLESMTGMKLGLASSQGPEEAAPEVGNTRSRQSPNATVTGTLQNQTRQMESDDPGLGGAGETRDHDAIDHKEIPMAISEVSCAGFKLTRMGRFTLKSGPVSHADNFQTKDSIENLNWTLLEAIVSAANDGG